VNVQKELEAEAEKLPPPSMTGFEIALALLIVVLLIGVIALWNIKLF